MNLKEIIALISYAKNYNKQIRIFLDDNRSITGKIKSVSSIIHDSIGNPYIIITISYKEFSFLTCKIQYKNESIKVDQIYYAVIIN